MSVREKKFSFLLRRIDLKHLTETLKSLTKPPQVQKITILTEDKEIPAVAVKFTENYLHLASLLGETLHESAKIKKLREYVKSQPKHRTVGILGQLAVEYYLCGKVLELIDHVYIGKGDSGDITIGNFKIDVKTRAQTYPVCVALVNRTQFEINPYPLYIFSSQAPPEPILRVNPPSFQRDTTIIWGYAWFQEIREKWDEDWKIKVKEKPEDYKGLNNQFPDCFKRDLTDIALEHPIEELVEIFKKPLEKSVKSER